MGLQILLGVVILTLTFIVVVASIQVFQLLHEIRLMVRRANAILQNTQTLSEASAKPVAAVNEFFTEVKQLVTHTQEEIISATPDRPVQTTHSVTSDQSDSSLPFRKSNRFFRRGGLTLRG